MQNLFNHILTI